MDVTQRPGIWASCALTGSAGDEPGKHRRRLAKVLK
jgi:hypothetical protein